MLNRLRGNQEIARLFLTAILGGVTVLTGLFTLSPALALDVLTYGGYWIILAAFLFFVWALWKNSSAIWQEFRWTRTDAWCAGGMGLLGMVLLVHEPSGFKVLMDEIQLLGTSMAMHFERAVYVPQRANDLQGIFELMVGQVDKRPMFFPFLVSCLHDLIGYRPENPFVLNAGLTFVLLALSYLAGRALGGWRAGIFAALGWVALPLLGQNSHGGGFEVLNLVMFLVTALLASWHYRQRDAWSLTALVYAGVLLAQTRYESPLYLAPVAIVIVLVWVEQRTVTLPWPVVFSPVLLFPVVLLERVFEARPGSWELASKPGYEHVFALGNVPENLGHAFAFWFNFGVEQPNAPALAALGLLAVVLCLARLGHLWRTWREQPPAVRIAVIFGVALLAHLALMLCYFWGKFDDPVIRRLSLPTHLLFLFAVIVFVRFLPRPDRWLAGLVVVAFASLIISGIPSLARQAATRLYYPALDVEWRREFMRAWPEHDMLMIDNDSTFWITHLVSATPVVQARQRVEAIAFNLRNRMFNGIFVFQRFDIDEKTGALRIKPDDDLGPAYELETVAERTFRVDLLSRISRVKAIRLDTGARVEQAPIFPADPEEGGQERDAREKAFMEEWIKRLP
ncbi:MAG: hypothetical protein PHQ04_07800 [Opitutaceae bacterium]|nr:hypothetical protein [Opitutaceae bacterium]